MPVCKVDLIAANVDLLEELVGAPLEGHAGAQIPRGHEMDSGCGVVFRFREKSLPIDILNVGI
eukprot:3094248-Pyramimonas_sp.AAC.1